MTDFAVGDRVFGMPAFPNEARGYAEFVVGKACKFALTPGTLTGIEAAALPLAGLTAWQAVVETAALQPGQRVLVHATAGGVGHLAVQLARALDTVATVSAAKAKFVRNLGAEQVIDYRAQDFTEGLVPADVALDAVGGETQRRTLDVVREDGVLATLIPGTTPDVLDAAARRGVRHVEIHVVPDGEALRRIAALVSSGRLTPQVGAQFPLAQGRRCPRMSHRRKRHRQDRPHP
ncbi:MAG: NADP-dependent oxidoreductase [Propionibacteriaceae bacterium]|nr:NADP-dependent oxidoreductase [Propionibacteriaceae bacterium]